jgi:hypothetical protein
VDIRLRKFLDGTAHVPVCGDRLRTWCTAICHNNSALNHLLQEAKDSRSDMKHSTYQLYLFLWAAIVSWVGMAVVVSIADAICFDLLGSYYAVAKITLLLRYSYFCTLLVSQVTKEGKIMGNRRCGAALVSVFLV